MSGKECVLFFNNNYLIFSCLLTCVFLFIGFYFLLRLGEVYKTQTLLNQKLFGVCSKSINFFIILSMLVISSTLLSSADVLFYDQLNLNKIPIFSIILLTLCFLFSQKNILIIVNISTVIVPLIIIVLLAFLMHKNNFSLNVQVEKSPLISVIFYIGVNLFFSSPIIIKRGNKLNKKTSIYSALFSSIILSSLIFLLSAAIRFEGANAINSNFPFFYLLNGSKSIKTIFFVLMSLAIFTSLISVYYPLNCYFNDKLGKGGSFTLLFLCFLISRLGFNKILTLFYPTFGLIGIIYFLLIYIFIPKNNLKSRYKK